MILLLLSSLDFIHNSHIIIMIKHIADSSWKLFRNKAVVYLRWGHNAITELRKLLREASDSWKQLLVQITHKAVPEQTF